MKNRITFSIITLILVILSLFAACADPSDSASTKNYTVKFQANGGSPAPHSQSVARGGKVDMPPAMTKTGYIFGGWYREANCINLWNFATDTVTANITLYAEWNNAALFTCTVTFNANGGIPAPDPQIIPNGGKVVQPPAMTKTGYGFGGWYREAACINLWNFANDIVTGNITLYARWDDNYHTVTFNANGGYPAPNPQNIAHGSTVVPPPAMTNSGYGFGGWYKEAACINQWDFATDTVTGNITLYARWDDNYHIVYFDANGGYPDPEPQFIAHGGTVDMPPPMTNPGFYFGGWYKEPDCIDQWDFATDTVTDDIILYARWNNPGSSICTVTFNANGGSPAPNPQNITYGGKVVMPPAMTKTDYIFGGWYKEAACINQWNFAADTVTGNIILYARWSTPILVSGTTLADKLQWLRDNAVSNSAYILEVTAVYEALDPQDLSYGGSNITIQLKGTASSRTIDLLYNGSLFSIGNGVTLVLDENLVLLGRNSNNDSLVRVEAGGTLIMNQGAKISGNSGGGVYVAGTFTMNGGEISGNTASRGGGVYVNSGTFTMNGGEIFGNTASNGGGVYVGRSDYYYYDEDRGGTFTMSGGEISGNTASGSGYDDRGGGGGVYVDSGTFTMSGGEIFGNTASNGGGVYVGRSDYYYYDEDRGGTFTMNGGEISGNTATAASSSYGNRGGGGVYVSQNSTFTMSGGEISGNTASASSSYDSSSYGGGVYVGGTFTMSGGEISGNTASSSSSYSGNGGGVYVSQNSTFTMSGGEISGNTATAASSYGNRGGGGGVCVDEGNFTMSGGEISGNTAYFGGGVYVVGSDGIFIKSGGGTITGYASDTVNGNVAKNSSGDVRSYCGHTVFIESSESRSAQRRETTAGPGVNLYSRVEGTLGGWED